MRWGAEMSAQESIAAWVDQLTAQDAYEEATAVRQVLVSRMKAAGQKLADLTPEISGAALAEYWPGAQARWDGLPDMDAGAIDAAAPLVTQWLKMFDDGRTAPGLLSVDDYQGVLHALRCAMRGTGLELPKQTTPIDAKLLGGKFDLKGKL